MITSVEQAREKVLGMPYRKKVDSPDSDCQEFWFSKGYLAALQDPIVKGLVEAAIELKVSGYDEMEVKQFEEALLAYHKAIKP